MAQLKYWDGSAWVYAVVGAQGPTGQTGAQGTTGTQGLTGDQGIQGVQGTVGVQGVNGTQGITGTQGTTGAEGIQGTIGSTGLTGSQGTQGTQGFTGDTGAQGTQGTQGLLGTQGATGLVPTDYVSTVGGSTITVASGATVPLTIQNNGTGNSFVVNDEAGDASPFTIASDGNVSLGSTTAPSGVSQLGLMLSTNIASGRNFILRKAAPSGNAPAYSFMKSNGTNELPTPVVSGDALGNLFWESYDGTNYVEAASIMTYADNTVSTGAVPGRLIFNTNSISGARTERMRIDSAGNTTINAIAGGTTTTATVGAGYMGLPQNATTTGAAIVAAADAGKHIYSTATRTITIDSNANLALPIGTTVTFVAAAGATVTIAITTDTLLLAGAGTTGSRTLAAHGMATAVKITATSWIISGNGLT